MTAFVQHKTAPHQRPTSISGRHRGHRALSVIAASNLLANVQIIARLRARNDSPTYLHKHTGVLFVFLHSLFSNAAFLRFILGVANDLSKNNIFIAAYA